MSDESSIHDAVREWDGAYVLGALSPEERLLFGRHLAECALCRASLSELAALPGLLALVTPAEAEAALGRQEKPAVDLMPQLVRRVGRRRIRNRLLVVAGAFAAAAAALLLAPLMMPASTTTPLAGRVTVPLESVATTSPASTSLAASVELAPRQWGTSIEMECSYRGGQAYGSPVEYALYLTDARGGEVQVASWASTPGKTATPSATTSLQISDITAVEIRDVRSGQVVLRGSP